ncbi:MAG: LUD domain-containing protein [Pelotomaculum sp.]|nr:LUD domain-containing protein [Pelotomaculum sp.]
MGRSNIRRQIAEVLADGKVSSALCRFANDYVASRERIYSGKNFLELREEISSAKQRAAGKMEVLAERFAEKLREKGAKVFFASSGHEARDYILRLASGRGVRTVVKSKSMASEEIHLNEYLQENGLEVVETDLGERIIQIYGQRPSHMVMPAIHLSRHEVAGIFSREGGEELPPDPGLLVKVARERLRQKFLSAGMGISGANIAVAETGTLIMVTNEGNGRLTTTLPPVHVVIVGLEKLVETMADAVPILEALPRSATAQAITSYVTFITGPAQGIDLEGNNIVKDMHVILLDNGRTRMSRDPVFKEALQCIRCASCLNVCPVYQQIGGHVFGHVYTGGIGAVLTAFFHGLEQSADIQSLCIGCERCKDFCPGKIDIPRLILELRKRVVEKEGLPFVPGFVLKKVLPARKLFHGSLRLASRIQGPFIDRKKGTVNLPPFLVGGLKNLPPLAGRPLRVRAAGGGGLSIRAAGRPKAGLFAGCLVDFVYPEIGQSVEKVLQSGGIGCVFIAGQTCCGYPARQMGDPGAMAVLARQNLSAMKQAGVDYIVTPCPTCTHALKNIYPSLLKQDSVYGPLAEETSARTYDFADFIYRQGYTKKGMLFKALGKKVAYHDSCHLKRSLGVAEQPRELLKMAGADLVEMKGADECCGFGGSYLLKYPEISGRILNKKLKNIIDSGAGLVAVECPGCLMQLRRGLAECGEAGVKVEFLADILAGSLAD